MLGKHHSYIIARKSHRKDQESVDKNQIHNILIRELRFTHLDHYFWGQVVIN